MAVLTSSPPDMPRYNGVVERALGLLRGKAIAMLQGITVAWSGRLWVKALNYSSYMLNMCVKT